MSDEDDGEVDMQDGQDEAGPDRSELRKMMADEKNAVAATLSQAAKADIEKGQAVKEQRKTFDSLLNTRIRLQKALQSTNSMAAVEDAPSADDNTILAAETAALNLWNSLNNLRESLQTERTGTKRKRPSFNVSTSSATIWSHMQFFEKANLPHRQSVLEKWSAKARNTTLLSASTRLNQAAQQTIVDVLNTHLSDPTRLVKRTRVARSCVPPQIAKTLSDSRLEDIYDDADFYGPLLKDLLEQRSQDNINALNGLSFQADASWKAAREAKTKKDVDTRASKGRKMRFVVQEKIQNFTAPEDRRKWGETQSEELLAGLFGRRAELDEREDEDGGEEDGDEGGVELVEDGFQMFGR